jgi:DNA-binding NtrC family response regulator
VTAGPLILVVDDDPSLRYLCRVNLELDGFRVAEAPSEEAARAALAAERPEVVFLDVRLGASDADGLLDELLVDAIPVVLVSGTMDAERYRRRAVEVLQKPFDPEALTAAARRATAGRVSAQ